MIYAFMTARLTGIALLAYLSIITPVNNCQAIPWLGRENICLESSLFVTAVS